MAEREIYTGSHDGYHWLTSPEDYSGTLLRLCPEIVTNRYLAVTSIDSGILRLSEEQVAAGWDSRRGIGYSPLIHPGDDIPHQYDGPDAPGYDEFYVFDAPCDLGEPFQGNVFTEHFVPAPGRVVVFASWAAFVLHQHNPYVQTLVDLFWPQLHRLQPESYIADGQDCLTFASRKKELVELLHERLANKVE